MRVKNKSIIVTGSGGGIGEGIARRLAAAGGQVIVNDIDAARGEKVAESIRAEIDSLKYKSFQINVEPTRQRLERELAAQA